MTQSSVVSSVAHWWQQQQRAQPQPNLLSHLWHSMGRSDASSDRLGDIWTVPSLESVAASEVTTHTPWSSSHQSTHHPVRICFRNFTRNPLLLCWMDFEGAPHHFYRLPPLSETRADAPVSLEDHLEHSYTGHAFGIYTYPEPAEAETHQTETHQTSLRRPRTKLPPSILLDPSTRLLGGYRPLRPGPEQSRRKGADAPSDVKTPVEDKDDEHPNHRYPCHLVTIHPVTPQAAESVPCCPRPLTFLRGSSSAVAEPLKALDPAASSKGRDPHADDDDDDDDTSIRLESRLVFLDPTPVDTTVQKQYRQYDLANWPVFMTRSDYNRLTKSQRAALEADLSVLQQCLPKHAIAALRCNTPLYINHSFTYGPVQCPQRATGACFHPHVDWLIQNGIHRQKVECVEIYCLEEYFRERQHNIWQPGGLLLHEYSHAYHYKLLPQGYDNPTVRECYEAAMRDGLYQRVAYHTRRGTNAMAPAYACTNAMEYFAELSVAFLGGVDPTVEFNKWFPFHRAQIQQHDPRAYDMLRRLWRMENEVP